MEIRFDNPYRFSIQEYKFGDLPKLTLNNLFSDGRVASKFLERQIPIWFPSLTFVDAAGYDFVHHDGSKYEAKCFTKSGVNYSASKYQGSGREIKLEEHKEHAYKTKYILCDVVSFPHITIVFFDGSVLLGRYPNGVIKYARRNELFCERSNLFD